MEKYEKNKDEIAEIKRKPVYMRFSVMDDKWDTSSWYIMQIRLARYRMKFSYFMMGSDQNFEPFKKVFPNYYRAVFGEGIDCLRYRKHEKKAIRGILTQKLKFNEDDAEKIQKYNDFCGCASQAFREMNAPMKDDNKYDAIADFLKNGFTHMDCAIQRARDIVERNQGRHSEALAKYAQYEGNIIGYACWNTFYKLEEGRLIFCDERLDDMFIKGYCDGLGGKLKGVDFTPVL